MASSHMIRNEGPVKIWSLLGSGDSTRVEAMLSLYGQLFPQYAHYVPRMRRRARLGEENRAGHLAHYWLAEVDGQPAGIRTFRYVRARHVGLAHALAVDPAFREVKVGGLRLSMFLAQACLDQVVADAERLGDDLPWGMVNEVESRNLLLHYKKYGILEMPVNYVEPIFPPEDPHRTRQEEIELIHFAPMCLGFLPAPGRDDQTYDSELISNFVLAFLVDHYGLPEEHPQVQAVLHSIPVFR